MFRERDDVAAVEDEVGLLSHVALPFGGRMVEPAQSLEATWANFTANGQTSPERGNTDGDTGPTQGPAAPSCAADTHE
ncbi:hypothetical protein GCM10009665_76100 [Kitasatospora nipponensis]|uniref:Uncharacterized protein n=1 Tax=Kitasatospora nipponensis TaxID=258049 RepID=A0ABN1T7V2_9ACTN